jgi:hypothetical protein
VRKIVTSAAALGLSQRTRRASVPVSVRDESRRDRRFGVESLNRNNMAFAVALSEEERPEQRLLVDVPASGRQGGPGRRQDAAEISTRGQLGNLQRAPQHVPDDKPHGAVDRL